MAQNSNLTIFQQINRAFNFGNSNKISDYVKLDREILKSDSLEGLRSKELETQQQVYLNNQFYKLSRHEYHRELIGQANRLRAYYDYQAMESYPLIKSAMDLVTEEAVCTGDDGKILNIYSDNKRIKNILDDLFYNICDINANLHAWTRNVVKYGENFLYLHQSKNEGIIETRQMTNISITRNEVFENELSKTIFKNIENSDEYNIFQVAHFRLLGDDAYLPYGSSYFAGVRDVWSKLIKAEDLMMSYRITRMSERNIFHVEVGNMNDNDVQTYMPRIAEVFKKAPQVDRTNGNVDMRYEPMNVDEDLLMPMRGGKKFVEMDKLAPASNLEAIADIEYLRENLFNALRIPKPFLSFAENAGDGKSLAMMDMRFAKQVGRVQRAMILELNKIAIIHLMLLGLDEEVDNFKLTMNFPSVQADMQKIERFKEKMTLYKDVTSKEDSGWAGMSKTNAKKKFLDMSDDDIIEDLKQQRVERMLDQELQDTVNKYKVTGLFTNVDKKFDNLNKSDEEKGASEPGGDDVSGDAPAPMKDMPVDDEAPAEKLSESFIAEYINNYYQTNYITQGNFIKKSKTFLNEIEDKNDIEETIKKVNDLIK